MAFPRAVSKVQSYVIGVTRVTAPTNPCLEFTTKRFRCIQDCKVTSAVGLVAGAKLRARYAGPYQGCTGNSSCPSMVPQGHEQAWNKVIGHVVVACMHSKNSGHVAHDVARKSGHVTFTSIGAGSPHSA
jgi:hypothetical protein